MAQYEAPRPLLYHFSDRSDISEFVPRPVVRDRPPGQEWLNDPLVWAIDADHDFVYLFPRDCPRILIWATDTTTDADRRRWLAPHPRVAYVEKSWVDRLPKATLWRYTLPAKGFITLNDIGMAVCREAVRPLRQDRLVDLPRRLRARSVGLRPVRDLKALTMLFDTSLHVSAIRLRKAH